MRPRLGAHLPPGPPMPIAFAPLILATAFALQPLGQFHGDEAVARDGERWLALQVDGKQARLVPTRARVRAVHDPILDGEGQATGRMVEAPGVPGALALLRGPGLKAGTVVHAPIGFDLLDAPVRMHTIAFGGRRYRFGVRCSSAPDRRRDVDCQVVLGEGRVEQRLLETTGTVSGAGDFYLGLEGTPGVLFAGDLDGDGRLDLIFDATAHYNVSVPVLYLSSKARAGELVGRVADHHSVGC